MSIAPGPRNSLTDVAGLHVGHHTDLALGSGTTAVIPDRPMVAAVDIRGGGTGTRDTAALASHGVVQAVHGIVLSGGSAYGLDAAGGVMTWLREQGRGFPVGSAIVPVVPSAILFDLRHGIRWQGHAPHRDFGYSAAAAAGPDFALGSVGAGTGAKAGRVKGGLGTASFRFWLGEAEATVAALVAVNPLGSVLVPGSRAFWARPFEQGGEFGNVPWPADAEADLGWQPDLPVAGANTTIGLVATDVALTKPEAERLAVMAQTGLARAVRPVHTPLDGDTVFAVSTGAVPLQNPVIGLSRLGLLAADCLARAVARGVHAADAVASLPEFVAWKDLGPSGEPAS